MLINDVISASFSTPRLGGIKLYQNNKIMTISSKVNTLLIQPFGTGKTTALISNMGEFPITDYTIPGLIGTIKDTGEFVKGSLFQYEGKTLLIDEIHNVPVKSKNALLDLLEFGRHKRSLGYSLKKAISHKYRYSYVKGKGTIFEIGVDFSCIASGTRIFNRSPNDKAWLSRFIVINIIKDLDDIFDLLKGRVDRNIKKIELEGTEFHFNDYYKYLKRFEEITRKSSFIKRLNSCDYGYITRACSHNIRLANYYSVLKGNTEISDDSWEKALDLLPLQIINYVLSALTEVEYKVYSYLKEGRKQNEIALEMGLDESRISQVTASLKAKGVYQEIEIFKKIEDEKK